MITPSDLYHVFTAVVPLYVAMGLAYASVKWWSIFTPEQCSGINRFVALFAVPLLSFHFIAMNNPYSMSFSFIAADSLQKLLILFSLFVWSKSSSSSSLDSSITFFSLSTLPNTLVMGIPLLRGMYGPPSSTLMVQTVVLQSILWYTLLLFLFEFRAATLLISHHFPNSASSIVSFSVHSDILSLHGSDPLDAQAQLGHDGKLHVTVRKSTSSRSDVFSRRSNGHASLLSLTPRPSNLTNAEIYSLQSSRNPTPRGSSFNHADLYTMVHGPRNSNFGNLGSEEEGGGAVTGCSSSSLPFRIPAMAAAALLSPAEAGRKTTADGMFVWNGSSSPVSEGGIHVFRAAEPTQQQQQLQKDGEEDLEEFSFQKKEGEEEGEGGERGENKIGKKKNTMPATSVMTRLILIMVWRKLVRNPNTYSSIIGLTWSLLSFRFDIEMPVIVAKSISILSDAGLGMAMFSLGLFMALQPRIIACGYRAATFSMGVRFLVGPGVMAATSAAVGLRGVLLQIAIVQAGLPQGIVPFVFAKEYNVHPDILSTGVIFGMLIALPIALLYYILLGL